MIRSPAAATPPPRRGLLTASGLLAAAGSAALLAGTGLDPATLRFWLALAGLGGSLLLVLLVRWLQSARVLGALHWLAVNGWVFLGLVLTGEAAFRLIGHDFDRVDGRTRDKRDAYPLCFQLPDQPLPEVFFQRKGLSEWTGRPLAGFLEARRGTDDAYADETPFTLRYDRDGFRNPPDLKDWEVVVVGDSFVESGYLPPDQLFTSVAAEASGLSLRNLGQVNTGAFAQIRFLRAFGPAPSCRRVVLAFYDGNDVIDTEQERQDLRRHEQDGWRPFRVPPPQTSLIKAAYRLVRDTLSFAPPRTFQDAWLTSGGREQPVTIRPAPMPVDPDRMTETQRRALEQALSDYAVAARELGMAPSLLYVPANNRTYHGLLRFSERADPEARSWIPGDLPAWMRDRCEQEGIRFIDACPALREAAERGVLVYNPILDTHLNVQGSQIVGRVLADALAGEQGAARPTGDSSPP